MFKPKVGFVPNYISSYHISFILWGHLAVIFFVAESRLVIKGNRAFLVKRQSFPTRPCLSQRHFYVNNLQPPVIFCHLICWGYLCLLFEWFVCFHVFYLCVSLFNYFNKWYAHKLLLFFVCFFQIIGRNHWYLVVTASMAAVCGVVCCCSVTQGLVEMLSMVLIFIRAQHYWMIFSNYSITLSIILSCLCTVKQPLHETEWSVSWSVCPPSSMVL